MKKIGTITFHSSYNYGSNLQAYALQEFIKKISNGNVDYKIINLRTNSQKEYYKGFYDYKGLKANIKKIVLAKYVKELRKKEIYYEEFINNKLQITREYNKLEELEKANFDFDYYIAGSDQTWNIRCVDFDWAFYLEFVKEKTCISYATSIGPKEMKLNNEEKIRLARDMKKFKSVSVREKECGILYKKLTGNDFTQNIDPTLLLKADEWKRIFTNKNIVKRKVYFLV